MNNKGQQKALGIQQAATQQGGQKPEERKDELCCNYDDNYYGDQACAPCDQVAQADQQE